MKYDPIMCMMVDDSVKTSDVSPVPRKKYLVNGHIVKVIKVDGDNVTVLNSDGMVTHIRIDAFNNAKQLDSKSIDKAIRSCDVNKNEGFKIHNASVRGDTLYIVYEDLLNSPGKKETESFTKTQAKGFAKDPWNTWLGTSKMVVENFIGEKIRG